MTTFFIDLWHDLRERRLWPVAVGLLAAIVAVPAILFKPVSDATPPTAAAPKPSGLATLPVVSVDSGPIRGSKLEAFSASEKNPFKPMKDLAKAPGASGTAGPGTGGGTGAASASGSSASGGSASGTGGSASGGSTAGGGSGSSGGGSGSGGSRAGGTGSSGGSTSGGSTTPTTKWFRYAADFSFGKTGAKAKVFKSVANFTLLPNETTPAVVFLGAGPDGKSAMFYVADPAFTADGEGSCNADGANCRYVTLKVGDSSDEETFSAVDGSVSYDLKLLKVNRQSLGSGSDPVAPAEPTKGKTLAATGAGVSAATQTTQDVLPATFAAGPGVAVVQK
jgi:hypothetical protein